MRLALYDPQHGYYSRHVKTVGRGGDFSTSATLHGSLGEAVAGWLQERDVIEVGGGDGSLAEGVLKAMGWWRRRGVNYHLVETSEPLKEKQRARLGKRVQWHDSVEDALAACGGVADVFSNELVDAFPAKSFRCDGDAWEEAFVTREGEEVFERSDYSPDAEARPGQRVEVQASYREWLAEWVPGWRRGRMLTIDYGWQWEQLKRQSPAGSLRAYFSQMCLTGQDFYQRVGRQDLTADVNFSELSKWGEELGIETRSIETQREFLMRSVSKAERRLEREPAFAFLVDEAGAGSAFLVLEQERRA